MVQGWSRRATLALKVLCRGAVQQLRTFLAWTPCVHSGHQATPPAFPPSMGQPGCTSLLLAGGPDVQGCDCRSSEALDRRWEVAGTCMAVAGPHGARLPRALRTAGRLQLNGPHSPGLPVPGLAGEEVSVLLGVAAISSLLRPLPLGFFQNKRRSLRLRDHVCAVLGGSRGVNTPPHGHGPQTQHVVGLRPVPAP